MVFNLETPVKNPTLTLGVMMFTNWSLLAHIFSITLEAKLTVNNNNKKKTSKPSTSTNNVCSDQGTPLS